MPESQIQLIYGEEDYLIEEHVNRIVAAALPGSDRSYGLTILADEQATPERIAAACMSGSMFSPSKVIIVKNWPPLSSTKSEIEESDVLDLFEKFKLLAPADTLLFVTNGKVDNRKKAVKKLKEVAQTSEYKAFASYEGDKVVTWIRQRVSQLGKKISQEPAYKMQQLLGENLRVIDNEIKKIITYIAQKEEISVDDVYTMASSVGANVFALLDHLNAGAAAKALESLENILHFGEEPIRLLGLLAAHFRSMLVIKSLYEDGKRAGEIASQAGKPPFIVDKTIKAIAHIPSGSFVTIMDHIAQSDFNMKTGRMKPDIALELLLVNILEITGKSIGHAKR